MTRKPSQKQQDAHRRKHSEAWNAWLEASSVVNRWAIDNGYGYFKGSEFAPIASERIPNLVAAEAKARAKLDAVEEAAIAAWCGYREHGRFGWVHH